jgi:hypothetical protein
LTYWLFQEKLLPILEVWYFARIMKAYYRSLLLLLLILGCATASVNPGMTLLVGLNGYQEEMQSLASRPERWPDRQRMAESLKTTYTATLGGSKEFNRLVDLDLRRKEFLIALRETSVRADRKREMNDELVTINQDVNGLKEIVKGQVTRAILHAQDQAQRIETIATVGLLYLTLDSFSTASNRAGLSAPSAKVGPNVVTDLGGSLASVRTPDGQTYRCSTILVPEQGAGIKCEMPGGK